MAKKLLTPEHLQLASVAIGGLGLLYLLFHKTAPSGLAGSSVPVLIGSGGDSGGSGLSPVAGDGGATMAPIVIPAIPEAQTGSVYAPNTISNVLGALSSPASGGCCAQNFSTPYMSVPVAKPILPDISQMSDTDILRQMVLNGQSIGNNFNPEVLGDQLGEIVHYARTTYADLGFG